MQSVTTDPGTVRVLSAGWGDTKLIFDPKNPGERIRAARIVTDMLRRGYALLVEVEGEWRRVHEFREDKCEYLIADFDSAVAAKVERESADEQEVEAAAAAEAPAAKAVPPSEEKRRRGRPRLKPIPAREARAIAVAPTAGG